MSISFAPACAFRVRAPPQYARGQCPHVMPAHDARTGALADLQAALRARVVRGSTRTRKAVGPETSHPREHRPRARPRTARTHPNARIKFSYPRVGEGFSAPLEER